MSDARHDPAIALVALCKSYQGVAALDGVNLQVERGECFALLGPNGAGKTTTMEICEGLTLPDSGEVRLLGLSWARDARTLRERIGVQLQETQLAERQTVLETLALFRSFFNRGFGLEDLLRMVQLENKRDARVATLSGGQKQRLSLACALAGDPEIVFLDEPTTGLDPQSRRELWALVRALKKAGRTILLTTHYMEEAEALCDRVGFVNGGQIVASGTPAELIAELGAEHMVEVHIEAEIFDVAPLLALPGVRGVRRVGENVKIETDDLHRALPAILVAFYRQSARLNSLRTRSASLEDVFVALTGRGLSDA